MPTPIAQRLSQTEYLTDGVTTNWNFSFSGGYILTSHVKAYREVVATGEQIAITVTEPMLIGPFQLQITPALAAGDKLVIYRDTPKDLPLVDFTDESGFSEVSLDTNAKQAIFVAAETQDLVNTSSSYDAEQAASQAALSAATSTTKAAEALGYAVAAQAAAASIVLPLSVVSGGTGETTAPAARIALGAATAGPLASSGITGAAASGVNTDITSISPSAIQDASIGQSKLSPNVAGTGPLFSAYQSVVQIIPAASFTKVSFQTEEYDTDAAFSAGTMVTNGDATNRFQPATAGYYQVNARWGPAGGVQAVCSIFKNGASYKIGTNVLTPHAGSGSVSAVVFLNGATDYIEIFAYSSAAVSVTAGIDTTYVQGYLVRAA